MNTKLIRLSIIVVSVILGSPIMPLNIEFDDVYAGYVNNLHKNSGGITENLRGITYGGGQFVVVGDNGTVATSPGGIYWTKQSSGISGGLNDVTYGDNKYVAVGSSIAWSLDGEDWMETTAAGAGFVGVTFGDAQFVAVRDGSIWTSPHGISWTEQSFDPAVYLNAVTWGNPGYVTVGHIGNFNEGQIYFSTDGIYWALVYSDTYAGFNNTKDVIYANLEYTAVGWSGRDFNSTDGVNWQDYHWNYDPWFEDITYGNSKYVVTTDWNYVYSWPNGSDQVQLDINIEDVGFGNSLFVIVGSGGNIYTSSDALTWTRRMPPISPTPVPTPSIAPSRDTFDSGDYNGDGTSDIAIFRRSSGLWAIRNLTRIYFGSSSDIPVSGDYAGDGTTEIGIFRRSSGLWAIRNVSRAYFGNSEDTPVPLRFNPSSACNIAIFRDSTGLWAIKDITRVYFGSSGDDPVPGDYNGDGTKELGIFRKSSGLWALRRVSRFYFGQSTDIPIPRNYGGAGICYSAIFRGSSGLWAIRGVTRVYYGNGGDWPVPADYNGDGTTGIGIFRDSTGLWAIRGVSRTYFGASGDIPVTR